MSEPLREPVPIGDLVAETSTLNYRFEVASERASRRAGLSHTRWQLLAAVALAPLSVAQIARRLDLARQSVQRTADLLAASGMVEYLGNPDHATAKLVTLGESGRLALELARAAQIEWRVRLRDSVARTEVVAAVQLMRRVRAELDDIDRAAPSKA